MKKSERSRSLSIQNKELYELEEFTSDDKKHHVIWHDGGSGYPIWWCATHRQSYFIDCAKFYNPESP